MDGDKKYSISLDKRTVHITLILLLLSAITVAALKGQEFRWNNNDPDQFSQVVPASIKEVYPLFMCPCCGMPLDPDAPCCGQATERINYISALSDAGLSNEEIVLITVKKYGIDLLIDESMKDNVMTEFERRAPADRPKIIVEPITYDFGNVSFAGGAVKASMTVVNEGESELVLNDMETSCGCTSATIEKDGKEGPAFGMRGHGPTPVGWSETLKPGETALLNIYYDPAVHPELRGAVTRIVTIHSNDPVDFKKDVRIDVVQVD